ASVVFITAYDQYAIRAFEVNALDYLLKPIRKERLHRTMQRLLGFEKAGKSIVQKMDLDDVVYLMVNGSLRFVKLSTIRCISAAGNYTQLYLKDGKKELVNKTLQEWETLLPEKYFVRIHRCTIVNFECVASVMKCENYSHLVCIKDIEKPFRMSRRYAQSLKKKLT
ncbi:MAG: response regulator transcription factor, partial [Syntrophaceae bacterium]|nr:response regulator transcription factor [Syntrophaceae bacterium]